MIKFVINHKQLSFHHMLEGSQPMKAWESLRSHETCLALIWGRIGHLDSFACLLFGPFLPHFSFLNFSLFSLPSSHGQFDTFQVLPSSDFPSSPLAWVTKTKGMETWDSPSLESPDLSLETWVSSLSLEPQIWISRLEIPSVSIFL